MASKYFRKSLAKITPENRRFVQKNLDIVEQIVSILDARGMSQRELAKRLGKSEAEVSRMLSGLHNLTLKTIAKLEAALEEDIITTPQKAQEQGYTIKRAKVISIKSQNLKQTAGGNTYRTQGEESSEMAAYKRGSGKIKILNHLNTISRGKQKVSYN